MRRFTFEQKTHSLWEELHAHQGHARKSQHFLHSRWGHGSAAHLVAWSLRWTPILPRDLPYSKGITLHRLHRQEWWPHPHLFTKSPHYGFIIWDSNLLKLFDLSLIIVVIIITIIIIISNVEASLSHKSKMIGSPFSILLTTGLVSAHLLCWLTLAYCWPTAWVVTDVPPGDEWDHVATPFPFWPFLLPLPFWSPSFPFWSPFPFVPLPLASLPWPFWCHSCPFCLFLWRLGPDQCLILATATVKVAHFCWERSHCRTCSLKVERWTLSCQIQAWLELPTYTSQKIADFNSSWIVVPALAVSSNTSSSFRSWGCSALFIENAGHVAAAPKSANPLAFEAGFKPLTNLPRHQTHWSPPQLFTYCSALPLINEASKP